MNPSPSHSDDRRERPGFRPLPARGKRAWRLCALGLLAFLLGSAEGGTQPKPAELLETPVGSLVPGGAALKSPVKNPEADDPQAAERGMGWFNSFNCVGCHAPNGAGGMGPKLSTRQFLYGSEPANIYLTIYQGRPRGMPAWGAMLPGNVIWDLVAYIRGLGDAPEKGWGTTVSRTMPEIEQIPAEYATTANPWSRTEAFSRGQKPNRTK